MSKTKIVAIIAGALILLLLLGPVFSIDLDKLIGKDDEPAKTTRPPTTTVPKVEEPEHAAVLSLATLLESFERVNGSSVVDGDVDFDRTDVIVPTSAIDTGEDGNEFNVMSSINSSVEVYETEYSYGSELVITFDYYGFDSSDSLDLSYRITLQHQDGTTITKQTAGMLSFLGNYCYTGSRSLLLTSGRDKTVSMYVNLAEGYVDYYVGDAYKCTVDYPYDSSYSIVSAFNLYFPTARVDRFFGGIHVSMYAPKSVTN